MTERSITGFEAAPQGQIGSGFAQVFDTSNLVQAAVQMRQVRQQQFDALISSLADIDPQLARPVDTQPIIQGVNQLQDFVIENYQSIADPRKDPSAAIEFRRRKNELLAAVNTSKQMGERALELAKELPKNDYYMGAFDRNRSLIEGLNSTPALSIGDDGAIVRSEEAVSLFNQRLAVGKGANEFATELADKTKPQFDPTNPNLQQVRLANGTFVMLHPDKVTNEQADVIIDSSLTGGGIDGVAVVNSVLGIEVPYDVLSDDEKQLVRDRIRPSFLQRLDTKPTTNIVRDPSSRGGDDRLNVETRMRSLRSVLTGQGDGSGILSTQNWADTGAQVDRIDRRFNDSGELVYDVILQKDGTISKKSYIIGKSEGGNLVLGADAGKGYKEGLTSFITAANVSLNRSQAGNLKTPDIEDINAPFMQQIKNDISQGLFEVEVGEGNVYQLDSKPASLKDLASSVDAVIGKTNTTRETTQAVTNIQRWAVDQGYNPKSINLTKSNKPNVVVLGVGNNKVSYDLSVPKQRESFINAYVRMVALPIGSPPPTQATPVVGGGGSTKSINPFE